MSCYYTHFNEIKWSSGLILLLEATMCTKVWTWWLPDKFWLLLNLATFRNSPIRQILSITNKSWYTVYFFRIMLQTCNINWCIKLNHMLWCNQKVISSSICLSNHLPFITVLSITDLVHPISMRFKEKLNKCSGRAANDSGNMSHI